MISETAVTSIDVGIVVLAVLALIPAVYYQIKVFATVKLPQFAQEDEKLGAIGRAGPGDPRKLWAFITTKREDRLNRKWIYSVAACTLAFFLVMLWFNVLRDAVVA